MITAACFVLSALAGWVGSRLPITAPWPALAAFLLSMALGGAGLARLTRTSTPEQARQTNALATIAAATAAVDANATESALTTLEAQAAAAATAAATHE